MPQQVFLTRRAQLQFDLALDFLIGHSPAAADRLIAHFERAFQQLADFPLSGARGVTPDTRRLVAAPYILTYRIRPDGLEILDIRHGRQRETPIPVELP
jgi:toxin ParE1/3/4